MKKKTILIVEDELPMLRMLDQAMKQEGFATIKAKNGVDGLAAALKRRPDLILLDIVMPKMDGMTVMKKLRADAWGRGVPIVLLTNLNADDTIMSGVVKHEPAYYLVKTNWNLDQIVEKVKTCLKGK